MVDPIMELKKYYQICKETFPELSPDGAMVCAVALSKLPQELKPGTLKIIGKKIVYK